MQDSGGDDEGPDLPPPCFGGFCRVCLGFWVCVSDCVVPSKSGQEKLDRKILVLFLISSVPEEDLQRPEGQLMGNFITRTREDLNANCWRLNMSYSKLR